MGNNKNIIIGIAVVVIIGVIGFIALRTVPQGPSPLPAPTTTAPKAGPSQAEINAVLQIPGASSTPETQATHLKAAEAIALDTQDIQVAGCSLDPVVARVNTAFKTTFTNNGTGTVSIGIDSAHSYAIQPWKSIIPDFGDKTPGLYGYGCIAGTVKTKGFLLLWK